MSLKTEIRPEAEYLSVNVTGKFLLKEAEQSFLHTLEAVIQHKSMKVLLDGRTITGKPATIERFFYGKFAANSVKAYKNRGVSPVTAFAYVLRPPVIDPQRFGETAAVNRGMHVRVFDNLEAAFEWLDIALPRKQAMGIHRKPQPGFT